MLTLIPLAGILLASKSLGSLIFSKFGPDNVFTELVRIKSRIALMFSPSLPSNFLLFYYHHRAFSHSSQNLSLFLSMLGNTKCSTQKKEKLGPLSIMSSLFFSPFLHPPQPPPPAP